MSSEKPVAYTRGDSSPYSKSSAFKAWQLLPFEVAPLNSSTDQNEAEIREYYKYVSSKQYSNTLFIIPQQHSRGLLRITSWAADTLSDVLRASPIFDKIICTFIRDDSDYYVGRTAAFFGPNDDTPTDHTDFEFACTLPYVEKNELRNTVLTKDSCQNEVQQWSVRQQGIYQCYRAGSSERQSTVLINPADALWNSVKSNYNKQTLDNKYDVAWRAFAVIMFESLTTNWAAYISCLHRAVEKIKRDASFTHHDRFDLGEADTQSLRHGLELMDRLQTVSHVLGNMNDTLNMVLEEAKRQEEIWEPATAASDKLLFGKSVAGVVREIEFECTQVGLIMTRLDAVLNMVRDLIHLRGTHIMEQMTARTILEAHTMRIIALVTLCFLPPTFIAGLLEMGYIDIALDSGHFTMNVEPGFFLYLIVTIPVVLLVVGGFLWWDWRSTKSAKTIGKSLV